MPVNQELVEIFGAEFAGNIASAVGELTPELEGLLVNVSKQMDISATVFGEKLNKQAGMLLGNGLSQDAVRANISKDMTEGGRIFGEMKNAIKGDLAEATNQAGRMGQIMEQGEKELFHWITVGGHRICPDCDGRGGEGGQPYSYWVENGLPGTGWSICQGWCYCVLDPTGKLPKKVNMPAKIAEKQATKPKIPINRTTKYPNKKTYTDPKKLKKASQEYWESHMGEIHGNSFYGSQINSNPASSSYYSYFQSGFKAINDYARNPVKGAIGGKRYNAMRKAYGEQPGYKGNTWRATGQVDMSDYRHRLHKYKTNKGKIVTEDMFFSSSTNPKFVNNWDQGRPFRIEFTIKSKTGISPDGLELSATEAEVLFDAKTQFRIIDVIEDVNSKSRLGATHHHRNFEMTAHVILEEI